MRDQRASPWVRLLHRRDYWRAVRSNQPFDGVDRPLRLFVHECEIVSLVLLEMDTATHQPATPQKKGRRRRFGVFFNEEEEEKICVALLLHPQRKKKSIINLNSKRREEKLLLKRPLTLAQRSSH